MASYIDSSFLLSIILEENLSSRTINVWQNEDIRVSSILLRAECIITLRRIHFNYKNKLPETWLKEKEIELKNLLQEVTLRIFDKSILDIIEIKKVLSNCRTLDAIHLVVYLVNSVTYFHAERAKSPDCFDSFFNIFDKSSRLNFHSKGFAIFS